MAGILCPVRRPKRTPKQFATIWPGAEILCNEAGVKMARSKEALAAAFRTAQFTLRHNKGVSP
jgi:hypothetical protein